MSLPQVVKEIGRISFEGNVLPPSWLQNIKTDAGKPDAIGAVLLSDIIYWYRPTAVRDEATGQIAGYKTKFGADKLQRSYEQLAEQFGFSKNQVRRSLKRLEERGLISIELRTITSKTGIRLSNVMFLEPIPEKIEEITYRITKSDEPQNNDNVDSYEQICPHLLTNLQTPTSKNVHTYTETSTETSTESTTRATSGNPLKKETVDQIIDAWNSIGLTQLHSINPNTNRHTLLKARISEYSLESIFKAIRNVNASNFLKGQNPNGWVITFDWFIKPNNFLKVLEDNYANEKPREPVYSSPEHKRL